MAAPVVFSRVGLTSAFQPRRLMIAPAANGWKRWLGVVPQAKEKSLDSLVFYESQIPELLRCDELQLFANP